jgi:hypothetical protein
MIRGASPDDICAFCDEFSVRQAAPEYAAIGMGQCQVAEAGRPLRHVAWDNPNCVSFRLDRVNLVARRQYVQVQKINQQEKA